MKWINPNDIKNWANTRNCQETLPLLVRKLIRVSTRKIESIKFPSGDNVLLGGWDGMLISGENTTFFPTGLSLWEFGTTKAVKGKADEDYEKRSNDPLGYNKSEATFIFVTPRAWTKGEKWAETKKKDGIWKDVKVINAEVLDEWIELAPTVGAWLSKLIEKFPNNGIQPADDFWKEWSSGVEFNLPPEILLGGREKEKEALLSRYKQPSVFAIQELSRQDALAFIIACFKNNPQLSEDFFSRSLIVDNIDTFRKLAVHKTPLILIPRFDDIGITNRATQQGHTVICPLGADSTTWRNNKIDLPRIDKSKFISALTSVGMTKEMAEKHSRESSRNITILRRQLEFTRNQPDWAIAKNAPDIIPALLVGRWDENFEKDRKFIEKISNDSYENYIGRLGKWLYSQDSPIIKIGSTWRLASPLDAWSNASLFISSGSFDIFASIVCEALSEINPLLKIPPKERFFPSSNVRYSVFSPWLREGIIQSLVLISTFGDKLYLNLNIKSNLWVDNIINNILNNDEPLIWKSIGKQLPLIAEASPKIFLSIVEKKITSTPSPINELFVEEDSFLMPTSHHVELLWALEGLAWIPEFLAKSCLVLTKLASIDPGGKLNNRPINSLREIFIPWHYQTLASFHERMEVLELLLKNELNIIWNLLKEMIPSGRSIAKDTYKPRWRLFEVEIEKEITYSYEELYKSYEKIIELLISYFDNSEKKLSDIITISTNVMSNAKRKELLVFTEKKYPEVNHKEYLVWNNLRNIISSHRAHPNAKWALGKNILNEYEKLYNFFTPQDDIERNIWMFQENRIKFPDFTFSKETTNDEKINYIRERRKKGLEKIYEKYDLKKVVQLSNNVNEKFTLGETLSLIIEEKDTICEMAKIYQEINEDKNYFFLQGFISRKSINEGVNYIMEIFEELRKTDVRDFILCKILISSKQCQEIWDYIEKLPSQYQKEYWENINPFFYRLSSEEKKYGLEGLLNYKRYLTCVDICSDFKDDFSQELIAEVLKIAATKESIEIVHFNSYKVSSLIRQLEGIDPKTIIQIEWLYFPILESSRISPSRLHKALSHDPSFFNEVLMYIYKSEVDEEVDEELSNEYLISRARRGMELLGSWKSLPKIEGSKEVDYHYLNQWINEARKQAIENGRINGADCYIGKMLAHYPVNDENNCPPDEICKIIESLKSDTLIRNFSCEIFNSNGSSTRGIYDGGGIERAKAKFFDDISSKLRNKFPTVSSIYKELALGYEADAKTMDEKAERDKLEY